MKFCVFGLGAIGGFVAARLALPRINEAIPQGKIASGIFLASLSVGVGILNAGCII